MTVNDKHYLLNRDNLTQTIQIQLTQKKTTLFNFFFIFFKSILHFKDLPEKDDPHSSCISGDTSSEIYGYISVSKDVFQRTLGQTTLQMGQHTVAMWMAAHLHYLLITVKVIAFKKVSFSDTQNPKFVC